MTTSYEEFDLIKIEGCYFPNTLKYLENFSDDLDLKGAELQNLERILPDLTSSMNLPNITQNEYIIKLVEDVLLLVRGLIKSRTRGDTILAVITFAKLRSDKSFTSQLLYEWERIMGPQLQGDESTIPETFGKLRKLMDSYESVKELPVFKKLYKFLIHCLGISLFQHLGVTWDIARFLKVEKAVIKRETSHIDFVYCLLDTVLFLCETGYQCMLTGNMDPFLHDGKNYSKWAEEAELLRVQSRYITNPEPHGFTVFDFLSRLDAAIEKGKSIVNFQKSNEAGYKICKIALNDLQTIRADALTKRLAQQDRKAPFALLIAGGSSVGKSTFTKLLYYHFGKLFKLPIDAEYRYVRNAFDQYWTNFNSSQWCVQLDDIAFLHPNKATSCDPSLVEMLQVVNNVPYVPTQADLADKGRTPLRARFVVATTNTEKLNAETFFACPLAVQRRLPYVITIVPKKEYLKDGAMLDTSKLPPPQAGCYPDFWDITIKRVKPSLKKGVHMGQTAEYETFATYDSITAFLQWFGEQARNAEGVQQASMDCDKFMSDADLCECGVPKPQCICGWLQSEEESNEELDTEWTRAVIARRPQEEQEDSQQSYAQGAHKRIIEQIADMNILVRLMFFFHLMVLRMMTHSTYFCLFMRYLLGWTYYFYPLGMLIQIPQFRMILIEMIGVKTHSALTKNKYVHVLIAAVSTALVLYKTVSFFRTWSYEEADSTTLQGVSEERGEKPQPKDDKQENVWYKDIYECTPFDVTPSTLSKVGWTMDQTVRFLEPNCVHFTSVRIQDGEKRVSNSRGICISGRTYVANSHSLPGESFELTVTFSSQKDGVNKNITFFITPNQYFRNVERDLIYLELPVPPKKNIMDFFPKDSYRGRFDGFYLGRMKDGSLYKNPVIAPVFMEKVRHSETSVAIVSPMWKGKYATPTVAGDCGSILISMTSMGPMILGIHVLGSSANNSLTGFAIALSDNDIKPMAELAISNSPPTLQVGDYKQELVELNKKSPVRYIENGTLEVYGSLNGFRGRMKSRVCKTFISDIAVEKGYIRKTAAPMMNSWIPWRKALLDMTRPVTLMNNGILAICGESFLQDILKGLSQNDLSELIIYDNVTALNGCPGLAYVDKLNRNTSAGFPFRKSKKFFLEAIEGEGELQHPVAATSEIMNEVDSIITKYENNTTYQPVFTASLKDEPTSLKKCAEGKTRVFCGAPMPWSIVVRKYLLSTIRVIQKNRFLFEAGPGTIAQSTEWDDIYQYITHYGEDRIVAGDYGKFDKRMPSSVILEAFKIIERILAHAGWSDKNLRVIRGIAEDTAFPTIDFNGDLIRCYGTNPSGHPLTVIINGLANSLYVRYCYFMRNPEHKVDNFKENVHLMTYGDDMIMGVSKSIDWFHHTAMKEELGQIDIEFTMADKEAISIPFINIKDATFLRRSWRFEPQLGYHVCPIEHASIDKMMTMCVRSKTISLELQAIEVLHTVVREYFWYGAEVFEEKRKMVYQIVEEANLHDYMRGDFPTWEQLVGEFEFASKLREHTYQIIDNSDLQSYFYDECSSWETLIKVFKTYLKL